MILMICIVMPESKCAISQADIRWKEMEAHMADIIIVTVLAIAVFFVVRSQLHKLRSGQCGGDCAGCHGSCAECQSCADSTERNV